MSEPRRCATCGRPEDNHPFRHPFVTATSPGDVPMLRTVEGYAVTLEPLKEDKAPDWLFDGGVVTEGGTVTSLLVFADEKAAIRYAGAQQARRGVRCLVVKVMVTDE